MDIIVKRHRPEDWPSGFAMMDAMHIELGDHEDWNQLHDFHYKTETSTFGPTYYRCMLENKLVGVVVVSYPKLLLEPRHRLFPKFKPGADNKLVNTRRAKMVNETFGIVSRTVVDTMYRGVGVSYRMLNLAARMHPRKVIEIQSAMSKYNPFAMKAGFVFAKPKMPVNYEKAVRMFKRHFKAHPMDTESLLSELAGMTETRRELTLRELREFYYSCSTLEKTGRKLGNTVEGVATYSNLKLIKNIQGLCFVSPLYGAYINPDFGRTLPEQLPLSAFDAQKVNEKLNLEALRK